MSINKKSKRIEKIEKTKEILINKIGYNIFANDEECNNNLTDIEDSTKAKIIISKKINKMLIII